MDFTAFFTYLALVPQLITIVKAAIIAVEAPGGGSDKFAAVVAIVESALQTLLPGNATVQQIAEIMEFVKPLINTLVALFKSQGQLPPSGPPITPPVQPPTPAITPAQQRADLEAKIAHVKNHLAQVEQQSPVNQSQVDNLTAKLADLEKQLSALPPA
jgi:hypothetical protein